MRDFSSRMIRLGVVTLLALGATGAARADDLKAAITAADARWVAAYASHDAKAVAAVYTADQIGDRAFYEAHRDDIMAAFREGRIRN